MAAPLLGPLLRPRLLPHHDDQQDGADRLRVPLLPGAGTRADGRLHRGAVLRKDLRGHQVSPAQQPDDFAAGSDPFLLPR